MDTSFWVQILIYLPLLKEGTTAEFPAISGSHHLPWQQMMLVHRHRGFNVYVLVKSIIAVNTIQKTQLFLMMSYTEN